MTLSVCQCKKLCTWKSAKAISSCYLRPHVRQIERVTYLYRTQGCTRFLMSTYSLLERPKHITASSFSMQGPQASATLWYTFCQHVCPSIFVPSSNIRPTEAQIQDGEVLRFPEPHYLVVMLRIWLTHTQTVLNSLWPYPLWFKNTQVKSTPLQREDKKCFKDTPSLTWGPGGKCTRNRKLGQMSKCDNGSTAQT